MGQSECPRRWGNFMDLWTSRRARRHVRRSSCRSICAWWVSLASFHTPSIVSLALEAQEFHAAAMLGETPYPHKSDRSMALVAPPAASATKQDLTGKEPFLLT